MSSVALETFTHAGLSWTARPDRRADVLELCARLPDPTTSGAVSVKASQARIVWRLQLGGRTVYVKRYRVRGWGERLKYLALSPRAIAEWDAAVALERAGIEAAPPVAVGVARRGPWLEDALFIADEVAGDPYHVLLERLRADRSDLGPLLEETAALFRRLVAANVFHPDLHGGNLLGRLEQGRPRLALVDLHALRFPRRLTARARARMLGKLAHSLWSMLDEPDLTRALALLAPDEVEALAVRRRIAGVERTRLRSRSKRCVVESTEFTHDQADGWRVWRRRDAPLDALLALVSSERPGLLNTPSGPRAVEVLRPGAGALATWKASHALRVRRVPTPGSFACFERVTLGRVREAALVRESTAGARALAALDPSERADPALLADALDVAARLHASGLRASAADLLATRDAAAPRGWRVLVTPSPTRLPTDDPVDPTEAQADLAALRAVLGG